MNSTRVISRMILDFPRTFCGFRNIGAVGRPSIRLCNFTVITAQGQFAGNGTHHKVSGKSQRKATEKRKAYRITRCDFINVALILETCKICLRRITDFFIKIRRILLRKSHGNRSKIVQGKNKGKQWNFKSRRRVRLIAL